MPALDNPNYERFCQEYVIDHIASAAYIRAGYSAIGANKNAPRLMAKSGIQARIKELDAETSKRLGISAERVKAEIAKVAFVNIDDIINNKTGEIKEGVSPADLACICGFKKQTGKINCTEVKVHDKLAALRMLGEALHIFDKEGFDPEGAGIGAVFIPQRLDDQTPESIVLCEDEENGNNNSVQAPNMEGR